MTTTITPSLGHAVWTQTGTGTTPGYDAIDVRRGFEGPDQGEGVETYNSYLVVQRGAGANMSVDIGMDSFAYVRGDAVTHQGIYRIAPHSATINEVVSAADGSNPRLDQVVLEVKDTTHDASGSNLAQTRIVAGTPTGGATLDNRSGAAALPSSAILLADILVATSDTSITTAEIRDRRPFIVGVIPPLLTDVDMVEVTSPAPEKSMESVAPLDLAQICALVRVHRRIVSATRIRWQYFQGATALTGNYVFSIHDASGRKIIDTGSVAFTGGTGSAQTRSETITATTLEAGMYYLVWGVDTTNAGTISYNGWGYQLGSTTQKSPVHAANIMATSLSGGVTAPTTVLGFTDYVGASVALHPVPRIALSVG